VFITKEYHSRVKCIMHSGKLRAQQTAEVLAEFINPFEGIQEAKGLNPFDEPLLWVERLADPEEDLMLVGHLPHLSRLSSYLLCQHEEEKIINYQMGSVVCLERDESSNWSIQWIGNTGNNHLS
ncbi:hypothetical protein MUP95_02405, partial [bacterium]|nr:hypothetical protein [bacterium]